MSTDPQTEPQTEPETTVPKGSQPTETINGQEIPAGTVDEFCEAVFGKKLSDGLSLLPGQLVLGIEKFKTAGGKAYRLTWIGRGKAWLAAEDTEPYRAKILAWAAGYELAAKTGVYFSEVTR